MVFPIICFTVAAILIVLLIVLIVRSQASHQEKNNVPIEEQPIKRIQSPEALVEIIETSTPSEPAEEKIEQSEIEVGLVPDDDEQVEEPATEPLKINDSSYREALKNFQAKKPELAKEKKQISDSDYRNALRSMTKKDK